VIPLRSIKEASSHPMGPTFCPVFLFNNTAEELHNNLSLHFRYLSINEEKIVLYDVLRQEHVFF